MQIPGIPDNVYLSIVSLCTYSAPSVDYILISVTCESLVYTNFVDP